MSTLWCCPSGISSADHGVAHLVRCPEGWLRRGCRGVWHARIMQVSVTWQLPEEVPVNLQGSWPCSAPSSWSCAPSRRYRKASSGTWFRKPGSFFQSQRAGSMFHSHRGRWRWQETCRAWTCLHSWWCLVWPFQPLLRQSWFGLLLSRCHFCKALLPCT